MRAGLQIAAEHDIAIDPHEKIVPFGDGWLISQKKGFTPCPWAFDLARFCPVRPQDRILDLGCGVGPLLLAIHQVHPGTALRSGIELNPDSVRHAAKNFQIAGGSGWGVIRGDIRTNQVRPVYDIVVSNPPFYPPGWGRQSEDLQIATATHSLAGDVSDFARAARRALAPKGQVVFIFDANRLTELLLAFSAVQLIAKKVQFLDDDRGKPSRVLVLASRDGGGLAVERRSFTQI